jgi:site-specific DNA recombinase
VVNRDAQTVKKIFSYYVEKHYSLSKICRQLEMEGILTPKKKKKWVSATVRHILKNEAYIGTSYFGKTQPLQGVESRTYRTSKGEKRIRAVIAREQKPRELWIPIKVPQIISESDFEIAQHKLEENRKTSSRNTRRPSILQGLIVCGYCRGSYHKKVRSKYTYYSCGRRMSGYDCCAPSVNQKDLDNIVWSHIINLLKEPSLLEAEMERRAQEDPGAKQLEANIKDLDKELTRLARARDKLLDAYQEGEMLTLDQLKDRLKAIESKCKALLKEKRSLEDFRASEEKVKNMRTHIEDLLLQIENSRDLSIEDKQNVLRLLVSEIVITSNEIEIRHCIPCHEKDSGNFSPLCSIGS